MFREAGFGICVAQELQKNIFHGKVPGPALKRYCNLHDRKDAIIHDIIVHNFPTKKNGFAVITRPALFEDCLRSRL